MPENSTEFRQKEGPVRPRPHQECRAPDRYFCGAVKCKKVGFTAPGMKKKGRCGSG
nr:MAG TPA: hypothetical protein [Caudoviricetes sp.]